MKTLSKVASFLGLSFICCHAQAPVQKSLGEIHDRLLAVGSSVETTATTYTGIIEGGPLSPDLANTTAKCTSTTENASALYTHLSGRLPWSKYRLEFRLNSEVADEYAMAVAFPPVGAVHACFETNNHRTVVRDLANPLVTLNTVIPGPAEYLSLAYSAVGELFVARASSSNLNYAFRDEGGHWQDEFISPGSRGVVQLAFDHGGLPWVVFRSRPALQVSAARRDESGWSIFTAQSESDPGIHESIAFNAAGAPIVASHHASTGELRYARFNGTGWFRETVDSEGDAGGYCQIATSSAGLVHIAYRSSATNSVRLARLIGQNWQTETVESDPSDADHGRNLSLTFLPTGEIQLFYRCAAGVRVATGHPGGSWHFANVPGTAGATSIHAAAGPGGAAAIGCQISDVFTSADPIPGKPLVLFHRAPFIH